MNQMNAQHVVRNVMENRNSQNIGDSARCQLYYWGEVNQMELCIATGCERIFETEKDLERHLRYHCGNHTQSLP